jgi:hypothetical protein
VRVYVAVVDPMVPGADYDPVRPLTEFSPVEGEPAIRAAATVSLKVERVTLRPVR